MLTNFETEEAPLEDVAESILEFNRPTKNDARPSIKLSRAQKTYLYLRRVLDFSAFVLSLIALPVVILARRGAPHVARAGVYADAPAAAASFPIYKRAPWSTR